MDKSNNNKRIIPLLILIVGLFFFPKEAGATATHLTQSDFINECGLADFSSPLFSFTGTGSECDMVSTRTHYTFDNTKTYYVEIGVTQTNGTHTMQVQEGCGDGHTTFGDTTGTKQWQLDPNSCVGDPYMQIAGGATNWASDSTAHIDSICISDVSYAECAGGGGGGDRVTFVDLGGYSLQATINDTTGVSGWEIDNAKNSPDFIAGSNLTGAPEEYVVNLNHDGQRDGLYYFYLCSVGQSQQQCSEMPVYSAYFVYSGGVLTESGNKSSGGGTRVISLTPEEGTTTGNTVLLSLHAWISPNDVGLFQKVRINFYNQNENIFLSSFGSPNLTVYFDLATTTGDFYAATTTILGDGNYSVQASLQGCFYLLGLCAYNGNNFDLITHTFIVNQETFIGHLQSKATRDIFNILASTTATSTTALIGTCNPVSGSFSMLQCISWLLVPSRADLVDSMHSFYNGFLTRVPWGYATRFFTLMASSSSATLPRVALTLPGNFPSGLAGVTIIDVAPFDAFASTSLIATATSSDGHTFFSSFLPIWNIVVLFAFAWFVAQELMSFFGGSSGPPEEGGRDEGVKINNRGGVGRNTYRPNRGDFNARK